MFTLRVAVLDVPGRGTVAREGRQKLGSLDGIPRLTTESAEPWLAEFDHVRAFFVGLIDGALSLRAIVDASGLPVERAAEILGELLADGVIAVQPPRARCHAMHPQLDMARRTLQQEQSHQHAA